MSVRLGLQPCMLALIIGLAACGDDSPTDPLAERFLDGTINDPGIALTIVSSTNSLLLLQTGSPTVRREIPLGASSAVTPSGFSIRGSRALIPLGNAASVALVDLEGLRTERFFTFPSGNATGSAWADDATAIVCNQTDDYCGLISLNQTDPAIGQTVEVTDFPTSVIAAGNRIFVISSNLDDNFQRIGNGVVTEIDPATLQVARTFTVGPNPQFGAVGNDGRLYVINSGDFGAANGSLSIIDLVTNVVETTVEGLGDFPGPISIDQQGRAFISTFGLGTLVWDTGTRAFLRGVSDPVCAPLSGGGCRGASGAQVAPNGDLYQAFFGSAGDGLPAYLFVYDGSTLALQDSIAVPLGPNGIVIESFR
jgi:hypothetical protein